MSTIRTVEEWTARYPGGANSPGFPRIAEAMLREGRTEEGIELARQGLQFQPSLMSGHLVLARLYQAADRLDEAKSEFEAVLRMDPRCPSARFHLAQIAERLQWKSVALEHWRQLCDIEPWDETAREAYGRMLREAPGGSAEPKLTTPYNPALPGTPIAPMDLGQSENAYAFPPNANDSPVHESTSDDLADALPTASDWAFPAATDGATLEMPAAKASSIFAPPPSKVEPAPENILSDHSESNAANSQQLDQAAPFSGSDVASRLNDLFGLPQDEEIPVVESNPTDLDQAAVTGFVETSEEKSSDEAMAITQFQPAEIIEESVESSENSEVLLAEEQPELTGTTDFERAGETGFLEGQAAVDGDDIADRLDQIFSHSDTHMQEVVKASHMEPRQDSAEPNWTPVVPEAPGMLKPFESPEPQPADSEARAAGESNILEKDAVLNEDDFSTPSEVTGNDIADRLDALFDESATASSMIFKAPAQAESEAEVQPQAEWEQDTPEPAPAPVAAPNPFTDDSFSGRETMILSADSLLDSPALTTEPMQDLRAAAPEASMEAALEAAPEATSDMPAGLTSFPTAFGSGNIETVDLRPIPEAIQFATSDALTPENLGLPEVDANDVGNRLDDLFGVEAEAKATSTVPEFKSESMEFLQGEDSVPLEMALSPSSDLHFETTVPDASMVSGDDISSRLAEIFGDEGNETEEKAAQVLSAPSPEMESAARGTHYEPTDSPTIALENDLGSGTEDFPAMTLGESTASPVTDRTSSEAIQDGDFPPWLAETDTVEPSAASSAPAKTAFSEDEGQDDEEAFEPGTTSIATVTLAEIYFTQGLKEQALQIYRQLLDREPDNESARKRIQEIEASKADGDDKGSGPDDSRPRPGLKIPRRKK